LAEFAHNNRSHSSIGLFPFFINLGRHPNTGKEVGGTKEKVPSVDEFLRRDESGEERGRTGSEKDKRNHKAEIQHPQERQA